jgi:hypothetical protein
MRMHSYELVSLSRSSTLTSCQMRMHSYESSDLTAYKCIILYRLVTWQKESQKQICSHS